MPRVKSFKQVFTSPRQRAFSAYRSRVDRFLDRIFADTLLEPSDYAPGEEPVLFFEEKYRDEHTIDFQDLGESDSYETNLFERLTAEQPQWPVLVLVGGLGAGKTSAVKKVLNDIQSAATELRPSATCERCPRHRSCKYLPIYVDCNFVPDDAPQTNILNMVHREVRRQVFERIFADWFAEGGLESKVLASISQGEKTLRRLLVANDILARVDEEELEPVLAEIQDSDLLLETDLLASPPNLSELRELIQKKRKAAGSPVTRLFERLRSDPQASTQLTIATLNLYISRCHDNNPLNIICIDNIDHLPTTTIEKVCHSFQMVARRIAGRIQFLLPLRPSSVYAQAAFTYRTCCARHLAPNAFEVVLRRLTNHILSRPREELRTALSGKRSDRARGVANEELNYLLLTAYVYAKILFRGYAIAHEGAREADFLRLDGEYEILRKNVDINDGTLELLATTVRALVGTCSRYGMEQLRRFFDNVYSDQTFAVALYEKNIFIANARVPIPYKRLIGALLLDQVVGWRFSDRLINLYLSSRHGAIQRLSLTKLRILELLEREGKIELAALAGQLSRYGISAEDTIETLNDLRLRRRLLLWFSENSELSHDDLNEQVHYVTISEHGLHYFRHLMGDFEYVWACACGISGRRLEEAAFENRLLEYGELIAALGERELIQIAFLFSMSNFAMSRADAVREESMLVLRVLYSSFDRALISTNAAISKVAQGSDLDTADYIEHLDSRIRRICDLVAHWQALYVCCFGSHGYVAKYREEIGRLQKSDQ